MINCIYQLTQPKVFTIKYEDITIGNDVIIKPTYMALCHADQRYYQGKRDKSVLAKKLPMALIHECVGKVVFDPSNTYNVGDTVAIIPNVNSDCDPKIFPNYDKNAYFMSSGHDGFMREYIKTSPNQIVKINSPATVSCICEFISVACHAYHRFITTSHANRNIIGIWGDGSLSFVLATVLKAKLPNSKIYVFGKDPSKLSLFSFVDKTFYVDDIPKDIKIDHAFECVGNAASANAISDIISHINPQGTVCLMGVSEHGVAIDTRNVLEKGLSLIGCSRSNRDDFLMAASLLEDRTIQNRLYSIIEEAGNVRCVNDIHKVFAFDAMTPFKTIFKWEM